MTADQLCTSNLMLRLVIALMTNQSWYDHKLDFVGFLEGFVGFGIIPVVLGWGIRWAAKT